VSFFVRWEGGFMDQVDQFAAVAGVRFMLDDEETLKASDRGTFRDSCLGLLIGARIC
jgi:hypothetical protein